MNKNEGSCNAGLAIGNFIIDRRRRDFQTYFSGVGRLTLNPVIASPLLPSNMIVG